MYNANNIDAAITVGIYFKVGLTAIKEALEAYVPVNNRSQLLIKGSNEIILDAYNANPSSMAVAIANFVQLEKNNKVMILGDMFELGDESKEEHKALVDSLVLNLQIKCFFIGEAFYDCKNDNHNFKFYKSFNDFSEYLKGNSFDNSMLLIKGSRGMALERTLDYLN